MSTRWQTNLIDEDYHSIKSHFSSSQLKLFHQNELLFQWHHVLGNPVADSPTKRFGRLFHSAALQPEIFFKLAKTRATAPKGALIQKDEIPISQKDFESIQWMIKRISLNPIISSILKEGEKEISGFYECEDSGLALKIRPDLIWREREWIVDLKTARDLSDRSIKNSIEEYRYDFSAAMYCEGASVIESKSYNKFIFIFVQNCPPFDCRVIPCAERYFEIGKWDLKKTKTRLSAAIKENHFKGFDPEAVEIEPNYWHFERYLKEVNDE